MEYVLKQFDTPLLRFAATTDSNTPEVTITWVNEAERQRLPLDLELTPESISHWLRHRAIPRNRAYVTAFLSRCGLSVNRPVDVLSVCKGLSLTDCYWVPTADDTAAFAKVNLYDNRFSNVLAAIAFTGYGSSVRSSLRSSPEFTTNGMLPKCWRRIGGKVMLYKGGTMGFANTGFEPYSEYYAAQIARAMGVEAIDYGLSRWKGQLCSTCTLFTSKDYSFMPVGRLVPRGGMETVTAYYRKLGPQYEQAFADMLVLDAVICNTDRHFGNFGFLVDNHTNTIAAPAPLFDHGNALFSLAGADCWESEDALEDYIQTLAPCTYDDFIGTARRVMTDRQREAVRHLLTFTFKAHPRYNLPAKRRRAIERQVQKRARLLLE